MLTSNQIDRIVDAAPGWIASLAKYYIRFTDDDKFVALNAPAAVAELKTRIEQLETMEKAIAELDTFLFLLISMTERDDPPTHEQINANARAAVTTMRRIMKNTV